MLRHKTKVAVCLVLTKLAGFAGKPPQLLVAAQVLDSKANAVIVKELTIAFDLRARYFSLLYGEFTGKVIEPAKHFDKS